MHKKFQGGGNICIHSLVSMYKFYKEGVPTRRGMCASLGFWLVSWRSFKHGSLTFLHTYVLFYISPSVKQNLKTEC